MDLSCMSHVWQPLLPGSSIQLLAIWRCSDEKLGVNSKTVKPATCTASTHLLFCKRLRKFTHLATNSINVWLRTTSILQPKTNLLLYLSCRYIPSQPSLHWAVLTYQPTIQSALLRLGRSGSGHNTVTACIPWDHYYLCVLIWVHVKAGLPDHPDHQKCKPKKRMDNYGNCTLNALLILEGRVSICL